MQIIKRDKPEQVIEAGDLVAEPDSDVACWLGYKEDGNLEFPYILLSAQTGAVMDAYRNLEGIRQNCTLLAKNKDITLTY